MIIRYLFILSLFWTTALPATPPVKIYVMSGQSNMGVSAPRKEMESVAPEAVEWANSPANTVQYFWQTTDGSKQNEPGELIGAKWMWGYELILAHELSQYWAQRDPEQEFVIVKVSKGATGIGSWTPDREEATELYLTLRETILNAAKAIEAEGKQWEGGAFFWHQGENDTTSALGSSFAEAYTSHLEGLVNKSAEDNASGYPGLRPLLNAPDLPVIVGRVRTSDPRENTPIYRANLQEWVYAGKNQPAAMISCDDFTTTDGTHYDPPSIVLGARRFLGAYLNLIEPEAHPFPPRFEPAQRFFVHPLEGRLTSRNQNATIHYTMDGTEPTVGSPVAPDALVITETTVIKAIAVDETGNISRQAVIPFTQIENLWPAQEVETPSAALQYTLFRHEIPGIPETFPDFDALEIIETGEGAPTPEPGQAVRFSGWLDLPMDTAYRFRPSIARNGGKLLRFLVDGKEVVGPEGFTEIHSAMSVTRDALPLAAGLHSYTVELIHPVGWDNPLRVAPLIKGFQYEARPFEDALPPKDRSGE